MKSWACAAKWLFVVAAVVSSSKVVAGNEQQKAAVACDLAAYTQYKNDLGALYRKIGTRPITVEEVMADRRLTESYCLKQAACYVKNGAVAPSTLGQSFQSCLDAEAQQDARQLDDLMRDR